MSEESRTGFEISSPDYRHGGSVQVYNGTMQGPVDGPLELEEFDAKCLSCGRAFRARRMRTSDSGGVIVPPGRFVLLLFGGMKMTCITRDCQANGLLSASFEV